MFLKMPEHTNEEKEKLAYGKALRGCNYQGIDEKTGEMIMSFEHTYEGTLEFYFETGMEGHVSTLHDDRGWHESPSWQNKTKKFDGPLEKFKSLEWSTFLKSGEYLEVFENDKIIWEGLLISDIVKMGEKSYSYHFLPLGIDFDLWVKWCLKEYRAKVYTNTPVLAEDPKHKEYLDGLEHN